MLPITCVITVILSFTMILVPDPQRTAFGLSLNQSQRRIIGRPDASAPTGKVKIAEEH